MVGAGLVKLKFFFPRRVDIPGKVFFFFFVSVLCVGWDRFELMTLMTSSAVISLLEASLVEWNILIDLT